MKCQVKGCKDLAEYEDEETNDCSGMCYIIFVCRKHLLEGWIGTNNNKEAEERILSLSKKIDEHEET